MRRVLAVCAGAVLAAAGLVLGYLPFQTRGLSEAVQRLVRP